MLLRGDEARVLKAPYVSFKRGGIVSKCLLSMNGSESVDIKGDAGKEG